MLVPEMLAPASSMPKYTVSVSKEYLKFSSAHFTVFDDSSLERLHGHNYYVSVDVDCIDAPNGLALEFKQLKRAVKSLCDQLDEKVLLPTESPLVRVSKMEDRFEVTFQGAGFRKRYAFPCEDVELLPVANVTSETLAAFLCGELRKRLEQDWDRRERGAIENTILGFRVGVEETRGQTVRYSWEY